MYRLTLFGSPCLRWYVMFHILFIFFDKMQSFLDICIQFYRNSILQSMILAVTQAFCNCKLEFFQLFSGLLLKLCRTHRCTFLVGRTWSVEPGRSNPVGRTWFDHGGVTRTANAFSLCTSRAHDCVPRARTNRVGPTRLDRPAWTDQVRRTRFDHPGRG